jgi:hypothetical protein
LNDWRFIAVKEEEFMSLQYLLDDRTARVLYRIFGNDPITQNKALYLYLIQERLFEDGRQMGRHPDSNLDYEFVKITLPDGWHKPLEINYLQNIPKEILITRNNSWLFLRRGQAGL